MKDHVVKPDIVAPGNRIASIGADGYLNKTFKQNQVLKSDYELKGDDHGTDKYFRLSGSSMAAPMVSGAVALLLEKEPQLTPDQVKARLMLTATKEFPSFSISTDPATGQTYTSQYDIFTVGAGYLNIYAALSSGEVAPAGASAASPFAVYDRATSSFRLVTDYTALEDQSAAWGTFQEWGRSSIWDNSALWGTFRTWGLNSIWDNSAVWGGCRVWGNSVFTGGNSCLWGSSAVWNSSGIEGLSAVWGSLRSWSSQTLWGQDVDTVLATSVLVQGE